MTRPAPAPTQRGHPDRDWIDSVRKALDCWEAMAPPDPTSSVLGSGAIAAAEAAFSRMHSGRPALLLPSATYALRVGLQVLGVGAGDEVVCPIVDWPSGYAAITSLGATAVTVAVDPSTLTIDPSAAASARTSRTRAVVACHLHGICADVPALRRYLPGLGIVEDAAQALGSELDRQLAGTLGDIAALSLGPAKQIDAGEGGVLLCGHASGYERAVTAACHPLRQLLTGTADADPRAMGLRPHPMTAVLALCQLAAWSPRPAQVGRAATLRYLAEDPRTHPLGDPTRHGSTQRHVPVLVAADGDPSASPPLSWTRSGAQVLPGQPAEVKVAARLLTRVRLATVLNAE